MLIWAIFFTVLMLVMIAMEIFTVSVGLFTFLAAACAVISGYCAFRVNESTGFVISAVNILLYPSSLFFMVGRLRRSRMNNTTEIVPNSVSSASKAVPHVHSPEWAELLGKTGTAITVLRPAGVAQFGERRMDVVSTGEFIEAGRSIKALRVDQGNVLVVQEISA